MGAAKIMQSADKCTNLKNANSNSKNEKTATRTTTITKIVTAALLDNLVSVPPPLLAMRELLASQSHEKNKRISKRTNNRLQQKQNKAVYSNYIP